MSGYAMRIERLDTEHAPGNSRTKRHLNWLRGLRFDDRGARPGLGHDSVDDTRVDTPIKSPEPGRPESDR